MDGITVTNNTAQTTGPAIFSNRADQTRMGARGGALTMRFAATCRFSGGLRIRDGQGRLQGGPGLCPALGSLSRIDHPVGHWMVDVGHTLAPENTP
jgi:hypothetical protein